MSLVSKHCDNCKFFAPHTISYGTNTIQGSCRIMAPAKGGWPAVLPRDWCNEFEPKKGDTTDPCIDGHDFQPFKGSARCNDCGEMADCTETGAMNK